MSHPVRLRLSRSKGFNLQRHSAEVNGLAAVNVARPGKWGNPYKVGTCLIADAESAVMAFAANSPVGRLKGIDELRGKNLACWCRLDAPCHADVLLDEANQ
jgi:hypothetical protein